MHQRNKAIFDAEGRNGFPGMSDEERKHAMVRRLDSKAFEQQVIDEAGREVVVFCSASERLSDEAKKAIEQAANEVEGNADIFVVDASEEPGLVAKFAPDGKTTYILFQDGVEFSRTTEVLTADEIVRMATELEFGAD